MHYGLGCLPFSTAIEVSLNAHRVLMSQYHSHAQDVDDVYNRLEGQFDVNQVCFQFQENIQSTVDGVLQMYFGLGLSLEGMSGPIHLNQALAFAIEAFGCGLVLLTMTRLGSRVTIACCMLQGQLLYHI